MINLFSKFYNFLEFFKKKLRYSQFVKKITWTGSDCVRPVGVRSLGANGGRCWIFSELVCLDPSRMDRDRP
jgi:hypothetical protein